MDLLHVIPVNLNALLPTVVQTVYGIGKLLPWDVEVDCSTNFLLQRVPVLEDAAARNFFNLGKRAKSAGARSGD